MLMQTAPIPRDHSSVLVIRATPVMESLVLVDKPFLPCFKLVSSSAVRFICVMKII